MRQPGDFGEGIGWPLLRSGCLVSVMFATAALVTLATHDGNWFFGITIGGALAFWLGGRWIRPNKEEEAAASRRWFGLEE